jgi:hypothetical protein
LGQGWGVQWLGLHGLNFLQVTGKEQAPFLFDLPRGGTKEKGSGLGLGLESCQESSIKNRARLVMTSFLPSAAIRKLKPNSEIHLLCNSTYKTVSSSGKATHHLK